MPNYIVQEIERMQHKIHNQSYMLNKMERKYRSVKGDLIVRNALIVKMILNKGCDRTTEAGERGAGERVSDSQITSEGSST